MKKFSAIFICLLMLITCGLAGCATFSIDKVKYYNEVVAKVGDKNITRYELLSAYNSYGKTYFGSDEQEAINKTLDTIIEREVLYQYGVENNALYKPNVYQVNEAVKSMFDNLDEQMDDYIKQSKTILNIKIEETETEDEKSDTAYLLKDYKYSPRAKVVNVDGVNKIKYTEQKEEEITEEYIDTMYLEDHTKAGVIEEIKTKYLAHFKKSLEIEEKENATAIYNQSLKLLSSSLMEYEYYLRDANNKPYSKAQSDLIYRYIERNFNSQIQSLYLTNISNYYLEHEDLSIELLLEEYQNLSKISYNLYNSKDEEEDYKSKIKEIGTEGDSILYHPTPLEDGTKFGYFIHTLISFDETQKSQLKALESIPDQDEVKTEKEKIISQTKVRPRNAETGLIDEDAEYVTIGQIIDEYNSISGTTEQKLNKFIDFMFMYTGDTATLKAGMPYVVGTNGYSQMEQAFTDEAVKLMQTNVPGTMSSISITNLDSMCITSYGIHILYYVNSVDAYDVHHSEYESMYIKEKSETTIDPLNLCDKVLNPITGETYFDMLFDAVYPANSGSIYTSNNGYDDDEDRIIELYKDKVTRYTTKIKGTKTQI